MLSFQNAIVALKGMLLKSDVTAAVHECVTFYWFRIYNANTGEEKAFPQVPKSSRMQSGYELLSRVEKIKGHET